MASAAVEKRWEQVEAMVARGEVDGDLVGYCIPCGSPRLLEGHDAMGLGVPRNAMCSQCAKEVAR